MLAAFLSSLFVIAFAVGGRADALSSDVYYSSSQPDVCGWWANAAFPTGAAFTERYGEIRNCAAVDGVRSTWVMTTLGMQQSRGVLAVDRCRDMRCRDGRNDHPFASWSIYPAPRPGGVTLLGQPSPYVLLLSNGGGQVYFDLGSGRYFR